MAVFTESEARALCDMILGQSNADAALVKLVSASDGFTNFAENQPTAAGEASVATATLTSVVRGGTASVRWNDLSRNAVQNAVTRCQELARAAPEDPERMPPLGPQEFVSVGAFFSSTAELGTAERTSAVLAVIEPARAAGLVATGAIQRVVKSQAVADSAGLFDYHDSTMVSFTTTVRTADGTGVGWAGTTHNDWLLTTAPSELARQAIEKAQASQGAEPVAAGDYLVVLEPAAVRSVTQLLRASLDARAADAGRSVFSHAEGANRLGEQVIDERLTLLSDPEDPELLACPFSEDGFPLTQTIWIQDGLLRNLSYSRYWAQQQGRDPTPPGGGIKLTGGEGTTADLTQNVGRGILVTRLGHVRATNPASLDCTGYTRDGTFLIENGQIIRPVGNLRFADSVLGMLNKVETIGTAVRTVASESTSFGESVVVPALVVRDVHFTSVSEVP
jgi:predicted Zn-dependent protease